MSDTSEFDGLLDFSKALEEYAKVSDNVVEEEEKIAQDFVKDLLKTLIKVVFPAPFSPKSP